MMGLTHWQFEFLLCGYNSPSCTKMLVSRHARCVVIIFDNEEEDKIVAAGLVVCGLSARMEMSQHPTDAGHVA